MMVIRIILILLIFLGTQINGETRSMYVLCPPQFTPVGNMCYFISKDRVNWLDAHFECKERNGRLAEPIRKEDRLLRKHLNKLNGSNPSEIWIGARFNWERNKWQWGYNGEDLTYQSFSQMSADNKDLKFHCAILKPKLKYRWSAISCEQQLQYICQHRIKFVNEKKRLEIHKKWNETYPNEVATEVLHVLSKDDFLMLKKRRSGQHSRTRSNIRQTNDNEINHRSKFNDIYRNDLAYQKPNRKLLMNGRNRTNKQFDLNRYRAQGIRQTINFNSTRQQDRYNRQWRQKQRWNMITTRTIQPISAKYNDHSTTATARMMTTTRITTTTPKPVISNDVNHHDAYYMENYNQINRQDLERKSHSNIFNKATYQTEQSDHTELIRQRNEGATHQLAIQTNEILDNIVTTTVSPREMKKRRLESVRNHLNKLTPEQQELFYKRRAERNKKRGIGKRTPTEP